MSTRPLPRTLTAIKSQRITPSMHRITLGGPGIAGFPKEQEGAYVKLFLNQQADARPAVRTYTIRNQRRDEIDIDFALHGGNATGPATQWALSVEPGETIMIGGPGPAKPLPPDHDFYLIAGDMTALPAISANLAKLDRKARGLVAIEVQDDSDRVVLAAPQGMEMRWVVNPSPGSRPSLLVDTLRQTQWLDGRIAGWGAAEFGAMQNLRTLFRHELMLANSSVYVSSYWKAGLVEDEHKMLKREDANRQAS